MEPVTNSVSVAQEIMNRYSLELKRLEAQQRGVEQKISATKAKIEAAEEFLAASKKLSATQADKPPGTA